MATPEQFWRAFGSSSLEDGSTARFLVFPIGAARIKDPDRRLHPLAVTAVKAGVEAIRGLVRGNLGRPSVLTVDFDARRTQPGWRSRRPCGPARSMPS